MGQRLCLVCLCFCGLAFRASVVSDRVLFFPEILCHVIGWAIGYLSWMNKWIMEFLHLLGQLFH